MKASVYIATSLDGFIARENGELDWLPGSDGVSHSDAEDYGFAAFLDSVDALVMGRKTFEMVASFGQWPYGEKKVFVFTNILDKVPDSLAGKMELRSGSIADLYNELKRSGLKKLYVDGGKTIQGFLSLGLIDEITISRIPVLIGSGIPLFGLLPEDVQL